MPQILEGHLDGAQHSFAIVVSRYNESITSKLLQGALATLREHGADEGRIVVTWVPGAWEIPLLAEKLVASGRYSAVLCLGAVIRGETSHDRHINRQVSVSLGDIALRSGIPISFGVLTCDSLEQAIHRAGGNVGNKGVECAEASLRMANLLTQLSATEVDS